MFSLSGLLEHSCCLDLAEQVESKCRKASFCLRVCSGCGWTKRFLLAWDFLGIEWPVSGFHCRCLNLDLVLLVFWIVIWFAFLLLLFLYMLVIKDNCSSLPISTVQRWPSALKCGAVTLREVFGREKSFRRGKNLDSINLKCNYNILPALSLSGNLSVSTFLMVL